MNTKTIAAELIASHKEPSFTTYWNRYKSHFDMALYDRLVEEFNGTWMKNAAQALEVAELAELVANEVGDAFIVARAKALMGNAFLFTHRYQEAHLCYQQAETYFASVDNVIAVAGLQINQVSIMHELGRYDEAIRLANQARPLVSQDSEEKAKLYWANLEMNVGNSYRLTGQYEKALRTLQKARELYLSLGIKIQVARAHLNCALVLRDMDRFSEAAVIIGDAQQILIATEQHQEVARSQMMMGMLDYRRGQYQEALKHLTASRKGYERVSASTTVAFVDLYRSYVFLALNLLPETIRLSNVAARELRRNNQPQYQALALINHGVAQQHMSQFSLAERLFARARRLLYQAGSLPSLLKLDIQRAKLILRQGRTSTAERILQRVRRQLDLKQSPSLTVQLCLGEATCLLAQEPVQWEKIQPKMAAAQQLATQFRLRQLHIEVLHLQGTVELQQENPRAAIHALETAVHALKKWRQNLLWDEFRLGFMVDKLPIYDSLIQACHYLALQDQSYITLLFYHLSTMLTPAPPQVGQKMQAERVMQEQIQTLREEWYWFQSRLENHDALLEDRQSIPDRETMFENVYRIEAELTELVRQAKLSSPAVEDNLQSLGTTEPSEFLVQIQKMLDEASVYLHYYLVDGQSHLLLVDKDTITLLPNIVAQEQIEQILEAWRFHIGFPAALQAKSSLKLANLLLFQLYQQLCANLQPYWQGKACLYVSLPPHWQDMPFDACYNGRFYLAQQFEVTYLSQAQHLLNANKLVTSLQQKPTALVLGHSDNGRLDHALVEAKMIQTRLEPTHDVTLLLEDSATSESFQALCEEMALIHLGTHAIFRDDNPFFSWLRLADGRITVTEIYDLRLAKQPLVILSGCETGFSQPRGGGMLGMARAFQAAGAAGLVASRWPIVDDRAALFMHDFYVEYAGSKLASDALKFAKQNAIERGWHPFFWAGYIFIQG